MSNVTRLGRSLPRPGVLALACVLSLVLGFGTASKARAQWIAPYGGWGWGAGYGYGAGYGFGGYGGYSGWGWGMGMSLPDQWMMRYQMYALNNARYNLMSAEAASSYQAGALLRQQALQTMLQNDSANKYPSPGSSLPAVVSTSGNAPPAAGGETRRRGDEGETPFNKLVAPDGEILWPPSAPTDGDLADKRQAADEAISEVLRDFAQKPSVPVREIVAARRALGEYANPASRELRDRDPKDYDDWVNWVSSLDRGLRDLAGITGAQRPTSNTGAQRPTSNAPAEGRGADLRPESSPKSAGEVLRQEVQESPEPDTTPKTSPKSAGEILQEEVQESPESDTAPKTSPPETKHES